MKMVSWFVVGLALVSGFAGLETCSNSAFAAEPAAEIVGQRGRTSGRRYAPPTRAYRSFSVEPGIGDDTSAIAPPATPPRGVGGTRPSGGSKPSYMRGDSKARGRYHQ